MTVQEGMRLEPMAGTALSKTAPFPKQSISTDSTLDIPKNKHDKDVRVEISDFSTNQLQQFNANFNSILKSIRIADQSLAEVEASVDQVTSEMQTFLKMYPPYPPEGEEHVRLLKNFTAIRKQIEQLSVPQDDFAGVLLRTGPNDEVIEIKINDSIIGEQVQGAQKDLDSIALPELSITSNRKQIIEAEKTLGKFKSYLTGKRTSLMQDVRMLIETVR